MSTIAQRAKQAAEAPENAAQRDRNQRLGVDDDRPAQNPETDADAGAETADPRETDHPTGDKQAQENVDNESPA